MKDMIVRLVFNGDARSMDAVLQRSERRLKSFGGVARREFDHIRQAANSLQGKLAALGVSFGAVMLIKQSAALDQSLTRVGQTAGMSHVQVTGLRKEFFRMAKETGQSVEALRDGFNVAVQSGLKFSEALPVTEAVSHAMAVTGRSAEELTNALTVASQVFHFDLTNPKTAVELLDKMTVAGRAGNAELENLSNIYARVSVSAKRSGMNNDQTLAFIETLSLVEKLPERLATLTDSTLRLFTNPDYLLRAQAATKVKFFDDQGMRRDPLSILMDIMQKYKSLTKDTERMMFQRRAFQGADLDTKKGLELLFDKEIGALEKTAKITEDIKNASGQIKKDLPDALNNAEAQANRLKNTMRKAADEFIQPLNRGLSGAIKKMLDSKAEGGLDLSGKELAGYGAAALGLGYIGYRASGGALKKLLGRMGKTGAGIAEGKAIEYATGVTPVFVTNWPGTALDSIVPGNAAPGGKSTALKRMLPYLAGAGMVLGPVAATAIASDKYLATGGSARSLGMALHGMPESDFTDDSWINDRLKMPGVKNDVHINIFADFENRRVTVENTDPNTNAVVNLNRGSWNNVLGMQ